MMHFKSLVVAAAVAVAAPLFVTGCSDAGGREEASDAVGTVQAALSTVGSDGATYEFLAGTYLSVYSMTGGEGIPLDGPDSVLTKQLPVGSYSLDISWPIGIPQLSRTEGGVTTTVDATWTDMHPIAFSIVQDTTTPVVLHFNVKGLGDVTFEVGKLQVTIDVIHEDVTEVGLAKEEGTVNFYQESYADPAAPYATALDVSTGVDTAQVMWFASTGDWTQSNSAWVCKTGHLAAFGYSELGLGYRLAQVGGGDGQLCVFDGGATDWITVSFWRQGAAPGDQTAFLPDPSYYFSAWAQFPIGDIYDGETLQQSLLESPTPASGGFMGHYIYDGSGTTLLTQVSGAANASIQLLP